MPSSISANANHATLLKNQSTLKHRPECYCLSRHVLAVPSFSMRGIIIAQINLSDFRLLSSMNRRLSIERSYA